MSYWYKFFCEAERYPRIGLKICPFSKTCLKIHYELQYLFKWKIESFCIRLIISVVTNKSSAVVKTKKWIHRMKFNVKTVINCKSSIMYLVKISL